jgi:hypothetical protein
MHRRMQARYRATRGCAGLVEHDAGIVQRCGVPRVCGQHGVVAQEGFAQLALLVQAKGALEFGGDGHRQKRLSAPPQRITAPRERPRCRCA